MLKAISQTLPGFPELCPDSHVLVVGPPGTPMLICAYSLHATCYMFWHLFHCRTRPEGVLLAYAKRDLLVLCLVCPSETLLVILRSFCLPQCLAAHVKYRCFVLEAF